MFSLHKGLRLPLSETEAEAWGVKITILSGDFATTGIQLGTGFLSVLRGHGRKAAAAAGR